MRSASPLRPEVLSASRATESAASWLATLPTPVNGNARNDGGPDAGCSAVIVMSPLWSATRSIDALRRLSAGEAQAPQKCLAYRRCPPGYLGTAATSSVIWNTWRRRRTPCQCRGGGGPRFPASARRMLTASGEPRNGSQRAIIRWLRHHLILVSTFKRPTSLFQPKWSLRVKASGASKANGISLRLRNTPVVVTVPEPPDGDEYVRPVPKSGLLVHAETVPLIRVHVRSS